MPAQTLVGKFRTSDFFALLPPGFYIFIVTYSCFAVTSNDAAPPGSLGDIFVSLSDLLHEKPVLVVFVLFSCYLFGSIFRALPVYWAERTVPPFTAQFPYPDILKEVVSTLNSNAGAAKHDPTKMPDVTAGVPMHVFNFWKDTLCVKSPEGFVYFETFETRVRLFAGMIWAAWSGILGGLYITFAAWNVSGPAGLGIFVISLVVLSAFGYNFRRVRRQEARALLTIFAAWLQE